MDLDLGHLRALDALLAERHVSRAAERVDISQPAMSRTLSRLRSLFDDDLLIRGAGGYVLTTRAMALVEPTRRILRDLEALQVPARFAPERVSDQLTLAGLDFELQLFLPPLLARMQREAPHAKVRALQFSRAEFGMLDDLVADAVITAFPSPSERYRRRLLYRNEFACVMSPAMARRLGGRITLENYVELQHGLVSFEQQGEGLVDEALRALGLSRRVIVRLPGFLLVPQVCRQSDVVFTLPTRTALGFPRSPAVTWLPAPLDLVPTTTYLYWHPRNHQNPLQQWFRGLLFDCGDAMAAQSAGPAVASGPRRAASS